MTLLGNMFPPLCVLYRIINVKVFIKLILVFLYCAINHHHFCIASSPSLSEAKSSVSPTWRIIPPDNDYSTITRLVFQVNALGNTFDLTLHQNTRWLGPSYAEFDLGAEGEFISRSPDVEKNSAKHFQYVSNNDDRATRGNGDGSTDLVRWASLSLIADGIFGVIHTSSHAYHIEPIPIDGRFRTTKKSVSRNHTHRLYKRVSRFDAPEISGALAHDDSKGILLQVHPESQMRSQSRKLLAANPECHAGQTKFLELLIVNDKKRLDIHGRSTSDKTKAAVNIVDSYYAASPFKTCLRIVLIGQLSFSNKNPDEIIYRRCNTVQRGSLQGSGCFKCKQNSCESTSMREDEFESTSLLKSFQRWRSRNDFAIRSQFGSLDAVHMMTGHPLDGPVKGLAYIETVCRRPTSAVAVVESVSRAPGYQATILAHGMKPTLSPT